MASKDNKDEGLYFNIGAKTDKEQIRRVAAVSVNLGMKALRRMNRELQRKASEAKIKASSTTASMYERGGSTPTVKVANMAGDSSGFNTYLNKVINMYKDTLSPTDYVSKATSFLDQELNNVFKEYRNNQKDFFGDFVPRKYYTQNIEAINLARERVNISKEEIASLKKVNSLNEKQGKKLTENQELLKKFNEEYNVTGIVGIYAFRRISRYGRKLLSSIIELTIENEKLENGFSSLGNKVETLNSRMTEIKSNLGSAISSVLGPLIDVLGVGAGYISSLTKGFSELPFPLKQVLGIVTLLTIALPSIISLNMVLRYYASKVVKTLLQQAAAGSKAAAALVKYRGAIMSTISYMSLAIILALSLYNLFRKTNKETAKSKKTLGPSNFDDVNALTSNTSEIEKVTEKTEKWYKVISGVVAAISAGVLLMKIFGKSFGFAGFEKIKSFTEIFTKPSLLAGVAAIAAALAGVALVTKKIIDAFTKLKQNWDNLSTSTKVLSVVLGLASALLTLAGAIMLVKGALVGNWVNVGIGALLLGGGIGGAFGTNALIDKKTANLPKAAHGGITKGATVAMVGEGKYNEAIVPLGNSPEFSEMKQDITNAVLAGLAYNNGNSGQPINITINVDKDYIYRSYNQVAKQNGRSFA